MELSDYPPGFSTHRTRATPEEIERKKRWIKIQLERDERHRKKSIEEGKYLQTMSQRRIQHSVFPRIQKP
jgi:hypothetical protein